MLGKFLGNTILKYAEHTGLYNNFVSRDSLVGRSLELLTHLLLRERRLLVLLVLVGVGIARVGGLVDRIALVGGLEWNLRYASLESKVGEVCASAPGEDGEE